MYLLSVSKSMPFGILAASDFEISVKSLFKDDNCKMTAAKGPFIYYVITFLGILDPPPPPRQHVFSTKNRQKLAFSDLLLP